MYAEIAKLLLDDGKADEAEQFIKCGTECCINALIETMVKIPPQDLPIIAAAMQEMSKLSISHLRPDDTMEIFDMAAKAAADSLAPLYKMDDTKWAITIYPDGWGLEACRDDERLELEELQKIVGGHIEIIGTTVYSDIDEGDGVMMIINEEGKLKGLPKNAEATKIAKLYGCDAIVGNAVLMVSYGEELKGFSEAAVKEITSRLVSQKVKP